MRIIGTLRALDQARGAVRVEDVYDTHVDDLWEALTQPDRLARWIGDVSGDLRPGGEFSARFADGWEGGGRVEACEPPHRLLVSTWDDDGEPGDQQIEATLTRDGDRTRLVVEERGIPIDLLAAYGAGWQIHAESLAAYLVGADGPETKTRWDELVPFYRQLPHTDNVG